MTTVLQADDERTVLSDKELPFVPARFEADSPMTKQQMLFAWSQQWRLPLTLLFGLLISAAAFFAYQSKQADDSVSFGPPLTPPTASASESENDDAAEVAGATTVARERLTTTSIARSAGFDFDDDDDADQGRVTTVSTRDATTPSNSSTTADGSSTTSTSEPSSTVTTTASTASTSTSSTSTSTSTSTTTPAEILPVFIGDRVSTGDWDGPGFPGLTVTLLSDSNEDGVGESRVAVATTDNDGRYGFEPDPGCYVVVFSVPDGLRVLLGDVTRAVCVESGQTDGRADLVLGFPNVAPPPSCNIQIADSPFAGVEIVDPSRNFAPNYIFYGRNGQVVVRTADLGPPDDTTNPSRDTIEWTSERYGYEESRVYSVSAVDGNGFESVAVGCERRNI